MRLLYINNTLVDIDEETAIGIDFQAYDIKEPGKRKVNISNTFSIPKTSNNLALFGHPDNPLSTDKTIYNQLTCDYWVDNYRLINGASVRIEDINERINLFTAEKPSFWESIKDVKWSDFEAGLLGWLYTAKSYPIEISPTADPNFTNFITPYTTNTEGLFLPMYYGNMLNYNPGTGFLEDSTHINLRALDVPNSKYIKGGHFCVFYKTIFEYIESIYNVNLLTSEVGITGNIWDDTYAASAYVPIRNIAPRMAFNLGGVITGYFFAIEVTTFKFHPLEDVDDKKDKTLFDVVNAFMQHFNIIQEQIKVSGADAIQLSRFDDIETLADVVDFSGKLTGPHSFKSTIPNFSQNSTIRFKEFYPEADKGVNSRVITSLNKNIEVKNDLFEIDSYICNFRSITGGVIPDMSILESFKTSNVFVDGGQTDDNITISLTDSPLIINVQTVTASLKLQKAALYSLASEYSLLESINQYPKVFTIKKWLTLSDIFNLRFFKQYFVNELAGSFFINKISAFNPDKSKEPTTIELFRVSSKTPYPLNQDPYNPGIGNYYTDGLGQVFTDGLGNSFY